jgi:hypothetical protein
VNRLIRVLVVTCAVALVAAGCSDSTDPANQEPNGLADQDVVALFQTGARATTEASDVVVTGKTKVDGAAVDVTSRFGGDKAESSVVGKKFRFEVKSSGRVIFVRGDKAFWTNQVGSSEAQRIGNKWIRSLSEGALAPFNYFVDRNSLFRASGRIKKGDEGTVGDQPTIQVVDPPANTDSTWWFATTGDPVLVKCVLNGNSPYALDYSQVVIVDLPAPADTVDAAELRIPKSLQK